MTLGELENGDIFYHAIDEKRLSKNRFIVYGNPYGNKNKTFLRRCKNMKGDLVRKLCHTEVVKAGESIYKEKIQAMFK